MGEGACDGAYSEGCVRAPDTGGHRWGPGSRSHRSEKVHEDGKVPSWGQGDWWAGAGLHLDEKCTWPCSVV